MFKLISIDDEKELIVGYNPENADNFYEQSAKIANKKFDTELKKIKGQNKKVVLMCGGSASGKTEFIEKFCPTENEGEEIEGIIFDSTLSTTEGAKVKIDKILKSKNIPIICLILPYNLSRCLRAFHGRERKIPEKRFFETHSGGRKVALWIAKNFENVDLLIYYNLLANEAKEIDVEIDDEDNGQGFAEISFENKFEMINFLENSQYLEDEIKNLINENK